MIWRGVWRRVAQQQQHVKSQKRWMEDWTVCVCASGRNDDNNGERTSSRLEENTQCMIRWDDGCGGKKGNVAIQRRVYSFGGCDKWRWRMMVVVESKRRGEWLRRYFQCSLSLLFLTQVVVVVPFRLLATRCVVRRMMRFSFGVVVVVVNSRVGMTVFGKQLL